MESDLSPAGRQKTIAQGGSVALTQVQFQPRAPYLRAATGPSHVQSLQEPDQCSVLLRGLVHLADLRDAGVLLRAGRADLPDDGGHALDRAHDLLQVPTSAVWISFVGAPTVGGAEEIVEDIARGAWRVLQLRFCVCCDAVSADPKWRCDGRSPGRIRSQQWPAAAISRLLHGTGPWRAATVRRHQCCSSQLCPWCTEAAVGTSAWTPPANAGSRHRW